MLNKQKHKQLQNIDRMEASFYHQETRSNQNKLGNLQSSNRRKQELRDKIFSVSLKSKQEKKMSNPLQNTNKSHRK
jgi:hypothetical protein